MAGLAVDARLRPGGAVGVGRQIVVGAELAHMAVEAGGIEGVGPLLPVDRLLGGPGAEVAHPAGRGVEPLFGAHVIGHRQGLEAPPCQRGKEIIDVLAAQGVKDGIFLLLAFGAGFQDPTCPGAKVSPVTVLADDQVFGLGLSGWSGRTPGCKAAWPTRAGRWPRAGRTSRDIRYSSWSRRKGRVLERSAGSAWLTCAAAKPARQNINGYGH